MTDNTKKPTLEDMHRLGEEFRKRVDRDSLRSLEGLRGLPVSTFDRSTGEIADFNRDGKLSADEQLAFIAYDLIPYRNKTTRDVSVATSIRRYTQGDRVAIHSYIKQHLGMEAEPLPLAYLEIIQKAATITLNDGNDTQIPQAHWRRLPESRALGLRM